MSTLSKTNLIRLIFKVILLFSFVHFSSFSIAQNKEAALELIKEGVILHDRGNYQAAVEKYNQALKKDENNLDALAEKAMSLLSLEDYQESIKCCQKAIEMHPGNSNLKMVYVTYGNALDALNKPEKSLQVYEEGIKQFPDFYMLHFNHGVTLSGMEKNDEALLSFQKAVKANPKHGSSHNAIASIMKGKKKKVPALLATCVFLVVEPEGDRAKRNADFLREVLSIEKKKKGNNVIYLDIDAMSDSTKDGKLKENSFSSTEIALSIYGLINIDKQLKLKTDAQKLNYRLQNFCNSISDSKKENYGFFWEYYAPYFIEMKEKKFITTFSYIALASSGKKDVKKWIKSHPDEIKAFYLWSNNFEWKTN